MSLSLKDFLKGLAPEIKIQKNYLRPIVCWVLNISETHYYTSFDAILSTTQQNKIFQALLKVSQGMPLSRLLNYREFWSHKFLLNAATLDPRPDSETLIEMVLELLPQRDKSYRFIDLGTGSGCLILSLLKEYPQSVGTGTDISLEALSMAQKNAHVHHLQNRVRFLHTSWTSNIEETFDIICSNPPYISESSYSRLSSNVKNFDPYHALVGGQDGLQCYREIAVQCNAILNKNGFIVVEIGIGQEHQVSALCEQQSFILSHSKKDLNNIIRCLVFTRPTP